MPRGGAANRAWIRGCPNGGKPSTSDVVLPTPEYIGCGGGTRGGSETSQYP